MNEHIIIIGGGYTGIIIALLLNKLNHYQKAIHYKITIIDQSPCLLNGASKMVTRLSLGMQCIPHREEALSCLQGAMLFRQILPDVYSVSEKIQYSLPKSSRWFDATSEEYFYDELRESYRNYHSIFCHHHNNKDINKQFFGSPKEFIEKKESSLPHDPVENNLSVHEPVINPASLGAFLLYLLEQTTVKILLNHQITHMEEKENGYILKGIHKDKPFYISADQVINATNENAFSLNQMIDPDHNYQNMSTELSYSILLDTTKCLKKDHAHSYMKNKTECSFIPMNRKIGVLFCTGDQQSTLNHSIQNKYAPNIPDEWVKMINNTDCEAERFSEAMLKTSQEYYPFLDHAKIVKTIVHPVLTIPQIHHTLTRQVIKCLGKNKRWISAVPLSITMVPITALHVMNTVQFSCLNREKTTAQECLFVDVQHNVVLPKSLSYKDTPFLNDVDFKNRKRSFVTERYLPEQLI